MPAFSWLFGDSKPRRRRNSRARRAVARSRKVKRKITKPVKPFKYHV